MESKELLRDVYGLDPDDFRIERYRTAEQGLNENGRACRVSHRSGNVVYADRHTVYAENENLAICLAASNVSLATEGRANKPILELIAEYEDECCDFEDGKWMARTALRLEPAMADSQLRALVFGLANIVQGTPYRRPKAPRVPVKEVEVVGLAAKRYRESIRQELEQELFNGQGGSIELTFTIRTSKLKSGVVKKLYGTLKASKAFANLGGASRDIYATEKAHKKLSAILQRHAMVDDEPYVYITSGGTRHDGFHSTFRVVCKGEEDYETWTKHRV